MITMVANGIAKGSFHIADSGGGRGGLRTPFFYLAMIRQCALATRTPSLFCFGSIFFFAGFSAYKSSVVIVLTTRYMFCI